MINEDEIRREPEISDGKLKLSADERQELGSLIKTRIDTARNAMSTMLVNVDKWQDMYESKMDGKSFPWADCSNVNVPLIQSHVDTWHSSINDTIFSANPYVLVRPLSVFGDIKSKDAAQRVEDLLQDILANAMDIQNECDKIHLNALMQPIGIAKVTWRDDKRITKEIDTEYGYGQEVEKETIAYRGPKIETVDIRNYVIYPLTAKDPGEAILVGDRVRLTKSDMQDRVLKGKYDSEAVKSILEKTDSEQQSPSDYDAGAANEREDIDTVPTEEFWVWEVIMKHEVEKGKPTKDCIFAIESYTGTLLSAMEYPYWHGKRFYIPFRPFIRPSQRHFGRTLPQILEHCQSEINAIHNQRVDATSLAISKVFKRINGSQTETDAIKVFPGNVIDVGSADELTEFIINPQIPGVDIEMQAKEWSERASPINDIAAGKSMDGSNHTAREVSIVAAKGNLRINDVITRLQRSYIELAEQVLGLLYQFSTEEELKAMQVTADELKMPWRIIPQGSLANSDKQSKRQDAMFKYQTLMQNPLVATDMLKVYRVTADLLSAFDVEDIESYIGTEEELKQKLAMIAQQQAAQAQIQGGGQPNAQGQPPGAMGGTSNPVGAVSNTGVGG